MLSLLLQFILVTYCPIFVTILQDTSVLSPVFPLLLLVVFPAYTALNSSEQSLENHPILFLTVMVGPFIKLVMHMMVSCIELLLYFCVSFNFSMYQFLSPTLYYTNP